MSRYISENLRRIVAIRANYCCEYCRIREEDTLFVCEVDHIISIKHGGITELFNLAFACFFCNRNKGSDIATVLLPNRELIRLFDPRNDKWREHFQIDDGLILPLSKIGEATIKVLNMNESEKIIERRDLILMGLYPS